MNEPSRLTALKGILASVWKMQQRGQGRYIVAWLKSCQKDYLLDQAVPWLTFDSIAFLRKWVTPGMRVFEWGSGGSTFFWLKSGAICVSVEHDARWYAQIHSLLLMQYPSREIDYRLVLPERDSHAGNDPANPDLYVSKDPDAQGYSFHKYVSQIDNYPDEFFDVILIDGRARPSCIKHSVSKVKPGGLLILDNAERDYYTVQTGVFLLGFSVTKFPGVVPTVPEWSQTNVYLRTDIKESKQYLPSGVTRLHTA